MSSNATDALKSNAPSIEQPEQPVFVGILQFELLIRQRRSLKDKRRVVRSVRDRLHREHLVSVAETACLARNAANGAATSAATRPRNVRRDVQRDV